MIQIHFCNRASQEPFRSFVEDTVNYVCLPKDAQCQLFVEIEGKGELKIEADGEVIHFSLIDRSNRSLPVDEILNLTPPPLGTSFLSGLVHRLGEKRHRPVTEFTVTATQSEPTASVATYHFRLLSPEDFEQAFNAHLERHGQSRPEHFVTDWQIPSITLECWNCACACGKAICTSCGADQNEGGDQEG